MGISTPLEVPDEGRDYRMKAITIAGLVLFIIGVAVLVTLGWLAYCLILEILKTWNK